MSQAILSPVQSSTPSITLHNGKAITTSMNVASVFNKRHDHVVRDIRILSDNVPETFYAPNFGEVEYTDSKGETRPMYTMTRDGLTLLVMGYTGKKAMQFKLAYIEAFNAMEAQLKAQPVTDCHALPETTTPSTTESRRPLDKLVKVWAQQSRTPHAQCWTMVNTHFNLQSVTELPNEWIPDAIAFVQGRIDALPKALPDAAAAIPPAQTARRKHSPGPVERDIAALIDEIEAMYPLKRQFDDALRRLNNTVHPLFTATYGALGWHSHAGYPADALGDALGGAYWDSQRSMQAAFDHAHQFARVFRTLARLHGM